MAVMQNSIIFGGIDSADFGIYIGGEGTFDAPKRDVEMISIPGRNGAFALDRGRFENIEVTYSAFNHEPDLATFSAQLEGFRNAICSQKGYQRLTDTFHPDEYRMAAYIDGLEIKPIEYNTAATFDIKFDCKPQRYLTSGEESIDVDSGDIITNPTLFEASPMLEVEGYGNIYINGGLISISNNEIGETPISTRASITKSDTTLSVTLPITIDTSNLNSLNKIRVSASAAISFTVKDEYTPDGCSVGFVHGGSGTTNATGTAKSIKTFYKGFKYGITTTVNSTSVQFDDNWTYNGTAYQNYAYGEISFTYDGANTLQVTLDIDVSACYEDLTIKTLVVPTVLGVSTKSALGNPTYIDLDIGEAWISDGGSPLSVNDNIQMPSELPTLTPGANEVIYDNTITDLKIIPRWWKI